MVHLEYFFRQDIYVYDVMQEKRNSLCGVIIRVRIILTQFERHDQYGLQIIRKRIWRYTTIRVCPIPSAFVTAETTKPISIKFGIRGLP
jgi:hypothetical protein